MEVAPLSTGAVGKIPLGPPANLRLGPPCLLIPLGLTVWALPVSHVLEVFRPLRIEPLPDAPDFVSGVAIIRGEPTPVVALCRLLGNSHSPPGRFVLLRSGRIRVAIAVDAVTGVERMPAEEFQAAPQLSSRLSQETLDAMARIDPALLNVLSVSRLMTPVVCGGQE